MTYTGGSAPLDNRKAETKPGDNPTRLKTDILEGARTLQRLLAQQNSKIGSLKVENLIDSTIVKKIEDSGFFEKMNAEYGGK